MRRLPMAVALLVVITVVLAGCGGGGPEPIPPPANSGQVAGRITGAENAADYTITVDGRPVNVRPGANGEFTIPGVPPGAHTIGCIDPGGMQGGYVAVRVRRGRTVNAGDVSPNIGGQIAGMVTRWLSEGNLEPLAQVEVVATSGGGIILEPDPTGPTAPVPVGRGTDGNEVVINAFTDDSGSYLMKAVPPGPYDVSVVVAGNDPMIQFVWVEAGHTSVADFTLYPAPEQGVGTVKGTVTGEGEGPLEGAEITVTAGEPWPVPVPLPVARALAESRLDGGLLSAAAGSSEPGGSPDPTQPDSPPYIEVRVFGTLSDEDGRYLLNVPVGTHQIECWLEGWEWQGDEIVIERNKTTTKDFVLEKWDEPIPWPCPDNDPNCPVTSR